ncbi:hypothetical protein B0H10DRAFT_2231675 [Mycena sp. CBHHK59/15]|nr:hypothetical protein B0H10DRAFT_2231675 [Mycena sp. CBHHK59/15]
MPTHLDPPARNPDPDMHTALDPQNSGRTLSRRRACRAVHRRPIGADAWPARRREDARVRDDVHRADSASALRPLVTSLRRRGRVRFVLQSAKMRGTATARTHNFSIVHSSCLFADRGAFGSALCALVLSPTPLGTPIAPPNRLEGARPARLRGALAIVPRRLGGDSTRAWDVGRKPGAARAVPRGPRFEEEL